MNTIINTGENVKACCFNLKTELTCFSEKKDITGSLQDFSLVQYCLTK
jgi:hypothetical protein